LSRRTSAMRVSMLFQGKTRRSLQRLRRLFISFLFISSFMFSSTLLPPGSLVRYLHFTICDFTDLVEELVVFDFEVESELSCSDFIFVVFLNCFLNKLLG